jgi:hypothetical protein
VSALDLIEIVLDSVPKWAVSCLVLAVVLIPGAEPAVVHWVQRETVSEVRAEFKSLMPQAAHRDDAKRHEAAPVKSR